MNLFLLFAGWLAAPIVLGALLKGMFHAADVALARHHAAVLRTAAAERREGR